MKDIEGEVHAKIINENTSMCSGESTVTEAVKGEVERPIIGEQKTAEKPLMKNAQRKISKFSKGKDKTIKAKHGKMDKIEDNKIIKSDVELKQTNELTLFEENNEVFLYINFPIQFVLIQFRWLH
uniref:Candidate secreted effector n=2 Tax=Meloidogyne TaxID=189290 RepID=A0A914KTE7_MELIC